MTLAIAGGLVFFDANTLINFAVIDRLDILGRRYEGCAAWTDGVQFEVKRGVQSDRRIQRVLDVPWLGSPVEIEGVADLTRVELLRACLSGSSSRPTKHLGEAQTIFLLETSYESSIFITDDRPAADFARRRGLSVMDSVDVLRECYWKGEVGCPEAYDLLVEISHQGRGVRVPTHHSDVC
ncbi:MAG: hypothetical protein ACREXY_23340 [Gammaproteobacteria bacterium]